MTCILRCVIIIRMKAWQITAPGKIELTESASQKAAPGCVKIKILESLLSRPDINVYAGKTDAVLPVIPGGSCVGMVVESGEGVTELQRGDRVYVRPQRACGECPQCKAGKFSLCENTGIHGFTCDGFIRDFAIIHSSEGIALPERIPNEEAVFLDYISIAVQTINALELTKGDFLAITGASALGIILGQVALYYQAVPIIVDTNEEYLAKAKEMGLYYTINALETDPRSKIFHITGGKMAECVAHISSGEMRMTQSLDFTAKNGKYVIIGRYGCIGELECSLKDVVNKGITVTGICNGVKSMQTAVNILANKAISVKPLITKEVSFDEVPEVFEECVKNKRGHLKTLITFEQH